MPFRKFGLFNKCLNELINLDRFDEDVIKFTEKYENAEYKEMTYDFWKKTKKNDLWDILVRYFDKDFIKYNMFITNRSKKKDILYQFTHYSELVYDCACCHNEMYLLYIGDLRNKKSDGYMMKDKNGKLQYDLNNDLVCHHCYKPIKKYIKRLQLYSTF